MNAKAIIHIAKKELGLDEDTYRDMLQSVAGGKRSTAEMNARELRAVVEHLVHCGFKIRPGPRRRGGSGRDDAGAPRRYDELGERPGMASPAQLRMLEALWRQAARTPTDEAYRRFLEARFHLSDPRFIPDTLVTPLKAALLRMRKQK